MAQPWFKFDAERWLGDSRLRTVSLSAKAVWIDILCLMHQSEERGVLITAGIPWTQKEIAKRAQNGSKNVSKFVQELIEKEILNQREDGAFFSKRMVADETQEQTNKENGKKGGNPKILKGVNPPLNRGVKAKKSEVRSQKSDIGEPPTPLADPVEVSEEEPDLGQGPHPLPSPELVQEVFETWNACPNTTHTRFLPEIRRRQLMTRLRDRIFADHWREAIAKISASQFLSGWKPGLEWFLDEMNFVKVLEGNYNHASRAGPGNHGSATNRNPAHARPRNDEPAIPTIPL